jgi:meso-butanediol dehydrogenase/(S,S)-butanediol dehydrogenase/diacetyl reductase
MSAQTKVAIITGGGAGIGKACALRFAQEGYRVIIAEISEEDGQHCLHTIRGDGGEAIFFRGDVSQEVDCQAWAQAALDEWGRIDALVANAGVQIAGDLFEATEADWERVIGVNLIGVAHSCKAVLPAMVEQGSGAIVMISSINALVGVAGGEMPLYDASKAGVLAITRSLAIAHGQDGIRVNAICPGVTVTEYHERRAAARGQTPEDLRASLKGHALLGKPAEPYQIASAVYFLASADASHITGQSLVVDGGLTAMSHPL